MLLLYLTVKTSLLLIALFVSLKVFAQTEDELNSIAESYLAKNNLDSADYYLGLAEKLHQNYKRTVLNNSILCLKRGWAGAGIVEAHKVLLYTDDPDFIFKAHVNIGMAQEDLGNITQAILSYKTAYLYEKQDSISRKISFLEHYLASHYNTSDFIGDWIPFKSVNYGAIGAHSEKEIKNKLMREVLSIYIDSIAINKHIFYSKKFEFIKPEEMLKEYRNLELTGISTKAIELSMSNNSDFDDIIFFNSNLILRDVDGTVIFLKPK